MMRTDAGRQVMAIGHVALWARWPKKNITFWCTNYEKHPISIDFYFTWSKFVVFPNSDPTFLKLEVIHGRYWWNLNLFLYNSWCRIYLNNLYYIMYFFWSFLNSLQYKVNINKIKIKSVMEGNNSLYWRETTHYIVYYTEVSNFHGRISNCHQITSPFWSLTIWTYMYIWNMNFNSKYSMTFYFLIQPELSMTRPFEKRSMPFKPLEDYLM